MNEEMYRTLVETFMIAKAMQASDKSDEQLNNIQRDLRVITEGRIWQPIDDLLQRIMVNLLSVIRPHMDDFPKLPDTLKELVDMRTSELLATMSDDDRAWVRAWVEAMEAKHGIHATTAQNQAQDSDVVDCT